MHANKKKTIRANKKLVDCVAMESCIDRQIESSSAWHRKSYFARHTGIPMCATRKPPGWTATLEEEREEPRPTTKALHLSSKP